MGLVEQQDVGVAEQRLGHEHAQTQAALHDRELLIVVAGRDAETEQQ